MTFGLLGLGMAVVVSLLGVTPASATTEQPSHGDMASARGLGTNSMKFG